MAGAERSWEADEDAAPATSSEAARGGAAPCPPSREPLAGLAALCLLARIHQISAEPAHLAHQLGWSPGHVTGTQDLLLAARSLGLKAKASRTTADRLALAPLPALALVRDADGAGLVVVLAQCDGQRALYQDPSGVLQGGRPVIEPLDVFGERWTGGLILVTSRASLAGSLAQFDFSWFIPSLVKYRRLFGEVLLVSLFLQLFALVSPLFFQVVMDKVLVHRGLTTLDVLVIGLSVVVVFESVLTLLRTYVVNSSADVVVELAGGGLDSVESSVTYSLAAEVERLTLTGTGGTSATGNVLNNTLVGNAGNNTIDGGAGADTMIGGAGNDSYVVDNVGDVVAESAAGGNDTIRASITYTLSSEVEVLQLTGTVDINATGNASANVLFGNAGSNRLDGAAGADTMQGGAGDDTYVLGRGYGTESVQENDATVGNRDVLSLLSGISDDQVWFRHVGNNLEVSIIGTNDKAVVQNWYLGSQYHVEQFQTSDGKTLLDSKVQDLVNAMGSFAPPRHRADNAAAVVPERFAAGHRSGLGALIGESPDRRSKPVRLLVVHQNFPGQFGFMVGEWAKRPGWDVRGLGSATAPGLPGFDALVRYALHRKVHDGQHPYLRQTEAATLYGQAAARSMLALRKSGFVPDVILAHPGWGETLYAKDVFPTARLVHLCEWFYSAEGADLGFDPEFPITFDDRARIRTWNALHTLNLSQCDLGIAPTQWQKSRHPEIFHSKMVVQHEGIAIDELGPDPTATVTTPSGVTLRAGDPVITYVARNLEPYRGFHVFMRGLERIQRRMPTCHAVIVGGDEVSYGKAPKGSANWREHLQKKVTLEPGRTHFMGRVTRQQYLRVLQVSAAHVYLTYPFMLSWSLLEAMACGAPIVASDTAPVREVINGDTSCRLCGFFDVEGLVASIEATLQIRSTSHSAGASARQSVQLFDRRGALARYDECLDGLDRGGLGNPNTTISGNSAS